MTTRQIRALDVVRLAQQQTRQLWPEHVARAAADALAGPDAEAFVRFDVNGRAYEASAFPPGNFLSRTIRFGFDGASERII